MRGSRQPTVSAAARSIGLVRRRLADERRHQLVAAAAALALEARTGFGIALDRIGRERLDVGEDRLGEQAETSGSTPARVAAAASRRQATRAPTR